MLGDSSRALNHLQRIDIIVEEEGVYPLATKYPILNHKHSFPMRDMFALFRHPVLPKMTKLKRVKSAMLIFAL